MRTVVINLDRHGARRRHARRECRSLGYEPEIFTATDAQQLPPSWVESRVSDQMRKHLEDREYPSVNMGALACMDSHIRVWQRLLEEDRWPAMVLEDDFFWLDKPRVVSRLLKKICVEDFHVVLLGYSPRKPFVLDGGRGIGLESGYRLLPLSDVGRVSGAYAYILNQEGAAKLVHAQSEWIVREADDWAREYARGVDVKVLYKPVVHSGLFDSSIWLDRRRPSVKRLVSWAAAHNDFFRKLYARAISRRLANNYVASRHAPGKSGE